MKPKIEGICMEPRCFESAGQAGDSYCMSEEHDCKSYSRHFETRNIENHLHLIGSILVVGGNLFL